MESNSIFRKTQPFAQYLSEWDSFIKNNHMSDWADDLEELVDPEFITIVRPKRKKTNSVPNVEGIIKNWNIEKKFSSRKSNS